MNTRAVPLRHKDHSPTFELPDARGASHRWQVQVEINSFGLGLFKALSELGQSWNYRSEDECNSSIQDLTLDTLTTLARIWLAERLERELKAG